MRGVFTREERVVVLFLAVSLLVGSAVVRAGRVFPSAIPDFSGTSGQGGQVAAVDALPVWPVDINTAGVDDLVRLPGVGPVRASEIVRRRELRGGYSTLDELLEILDQDVTVIDPRVAEEELKALCLTYNIHIAVLSNQHHCRPHSDKLHPLGHIIRTNRIYNEGIPRFNGRQSDGRTDYINIHTKGTVDNRFLKKSFLLGRI